MQQYFLIILKTFKSKIIPIKNIDKFLTPTPELTPKLEPDPTAFDTPKSTKVKTKHKTSSLKLSEHFWNDIVYEEKNK